MATLEDFTEAERAALHRCVELAEAAARSGNGAFGSVLLDPDGRILAEDHNREAEGDPTLHPEFELARWAAAHLSPAERAAASVFTSGEHCPMCSAAHAWAGLGRIVYILSSAQLHRWRTERGMAAAPVAPLPISQVAPGQVALGPVDDLAERMWALHAATASAD